MSRWLHSGSVTGRDDLGLRTELAWAALHGLATLQAAGRIPHDADDRRLALLIDQWSRTAADGDLGDLRPRE